MSERFPFHTGLSSRLILLCTFPQPSSRDPVFLSDRRVHSHQKAITSDWLTPLTVYY